MDASNIITVMISEMLAERMLSLTVEQIYEQGVVQAQPWLAKPPLSLYPSFLSLCFPPTKRATITNSPLRQPPPFSGQQTLQLPPAHPTAATGVNSASSNLVQAASCGGEVLLGCWKLKDLLNVERSSQEDNQEDESDDDSDDVNESDSNLDNMDGSDSDLDGW
ncbi:putative gibberellin 2-beta-dioxygenase 2-like [Capsicum annuum]|nr:putative gibberellin 2-beta-dioxygenase 2-like [Capsicum annuum]